MAFSERAYGETASRGNAQALLDEAKKAEQERKVAAKQTILDRLNEDKTKGRLEIDALEKNIGKVALATTDATTQHDKLSANRKRLTQDLELVNLQIEAERLKAEGLKLLGLAHGKSRDALAKRTEELALKTAVVSAEMRLLSPKSPDEPVETGPRETRAKQTPTLSELRKQLSKAEQATINASSSARLAMETASEKVQQADAAAAKAEKKRAEVALDGNPSLPGGNDPLTPAKKR